MDIIKHLFISLMPVQALAVGLPAINTLLSSLIIGNVLGSSALGAIGFASPFMFIVSGFSSLIGIGSQILCGKYLGSGNEDSIKKLSILPESCAFLQDCFLLF